MKSMRVQTILTNLSHSLPQELQVQAHKMSELQAGDAPKCFAEMIEIPDLGEIDCRIETFLMMLHGESYLGKILISLFNMIEQLI